MNKRLIQGAMAVEAGAMSEQVFESDVSAGCAERFAHEDSERQVNGEEVGADEPCEGQGGEGFGDGGEVEDGGGLGEGAFWEEVAEGALFDVWGAIEEKGAGNNSAGGGGEITNDAFGYAVEVGAAGNDG